MKRIISLVLVCMLLVGSVFALASCGKTLSGKYEDALTGAVELEFKGKTVTIKTLFGTSEAEYKIEKNDDGDYEITFIYADGEDGEGGFDGTVSFSEGKEDGEKYIKIGGTKFVKED